MTPRQRLLLGGYHRYPMLLQRIQQDPFDHPHPIMQCPMLRNEDILPLIRIAAIERGTREIGVEGFGEGVDGVEKFDGETLYCGCLGCEDVSSRLSLQVTEFGDRAEVVVLKSQFWDAVESTFSSASSWSLGSTSRFGGGGGMSGFALGGLACAEPG